MPAESPSLYAAIVRANQPATVTGATPEVVSEAATQLNTHNEAISNAITGEVKSWLQKLMTSLTAPGAFVSPMGPCSPGAIGSFYAQLGVPTPSLPAAEIPSEDQIQKIVEKVVERLQQNYVLTPK